MVMRFILSTQFEYVPQGKRFSFIYFGKNSGRNCLHQGPIFLTRFYFKPKKSNHIHYKVWVKLLIYSQTSTVVPLKFGNEKVIHPRPYWACDYLCMLGLRLTHLSKRGPRAQHIVWEVFPAVPLRRVRRLLWNHESYASPVLCEDNLTVTSGVSSQSASNVGSDSMAWHHTLHKYGRRLLDGEVELAPYRFYDDITVRCPRCSRLLERAVVQPWEIFTKMPPMGNISDDLCRGW